MRVSVINGQTAARVKLREIRKLTAFLLQKSGKRAGIQWGEVSLLLADDATCHTTNKAHLGHDHATDVISFNLDPIPGDITTGAHAEIIVNVEHACRIGPRYGGPDHELALYIAHGCDHLAGEEDDTPAQRLRMRRRELRWVREASMRGLGEKLMMTAGSGQLSTAY